MNVDERPLRREEGGSVSGVFRNALPHALKLLVAVAVIVFLIDRGDIGWEALRASFGQWRYSVPAFLLLALTPLGQLWRWQSLLRASRVLLPHREVLSYLMVSKFCNMALPGYVSGDIIRGFYVTRRASETVPGNLPEKECPRTSPSVVVASILFDRVAGLVPLFVVCLLGLVGSVWYPLPAHMAAAVGAVAGAGVLVPCLLFYMAYRSPEAPALLRRISQRLRLQQPLVSFYEGAHHYVRNLKLMRQILGISFLNHCLAIASFMLYGAALAVPISWVSYLILVPLGLVITAIPVAPAGLGVGQVAFLALFHIVGTSQGANLFTLFMASHILINLGGAGLYFFTRFPLAEAGMADGRKGLGTRTSS